MITITTVFTALIVHIYIEYELSNSMVNKFNHLTTLLMDCITTREKK